MNARKAFDSVDREIRTIRRERGGAIELFGHCDERGIRKVHWQPGTLQRRAHVLTMSLRQVRDSRRRADEVLHPFRAFSVG